ncbi:MlaC/ttg2D family ABC transporter substrate-binding protein [Thiomicrorhabdus arctica]|uniref:MlaC/ttg2D family ABC transporter substrate-binding protein n=1 Tax=Thiomicrorhabdus arctica TaxID=131540 RepID=UPI00037A4B13|nr:ABC transporter substrate-binding protein [Thiomicrorhabdus arctica]
MKKTLQLFIITLLSCLWAVESYAVSVPQDDPAKMVSVLSKELIKAMNEQRVELESSPEKVKAFASIYVLPYVDTYKMARYVMGRHWRTATESQQSEFMAAFSNTLIRSYSQSLLKLKIESVNVMNAQTEKPGRVTVPSVVLQSDGNQTDVIYRAYLNAESKKWMLYDVSIEGISMLLNYRKAYDSDFSKIGIDAVIADMKAKNSAFNG